VQPSTEISRYGFAHVIVRDAVYRSISAGRAAKSHHRVARAIETLHGSVLDDHLDDLVFHYALGPSVDDARRAIDYAQRAAHQAINAAPRL
jgi:hypothetical protein